MAQMFANAVAYEEMMGRWSKRLAALFLDFVRIGDADKILDVGCGTGYLVQSILDRTRRAQIVGIDPAQAFIDYSRAHFPDARPIFDCGSALKLPYPDASFDHALSLLVFQFLQQPGTAAYEIRRVTRTGGTVAACTWDKAGQEMSDLFWEECVRLDPGAEEKARRPKVCNQIGQLSELWRATGFEGVEESGAGGALPLIRDALEGRARSEERLAVVGETEVEGAFPPQWGMNESMVEKLARQRLVRLRVEVDGAYATTFSADGVIVATPTGSTAYSFSARGPIVSPTVPCLVVTPIAAHMAFDRSFVLAADQVVTLEVVGEEPALLSADGRETVEVPVGTRVRIRASNRPARFVRRDDGSAFLPRVREKFGLPGDPDADDDPGEFDSARQLRGDPGPLDAGHSAAGRQYDCGERDRNARVAGRGGKRPAARNLRIQSVRPNVECRRREPKRQPQVVRPLRYDRRLREGSRRRRQEHV